MRVLLIEDEPTTAKSIELMLTTEGFNVYTTDLGEEGLDLGKLYDYDIILLDLNLPDMSGYEVLRALRVSKIKTPILILSGMGGIDDKVQAPAGSQSRFSTESEDTLGSGSGEIVMLSNSETPASNKGSGSPPAAGNGANGAESFHIHELLPALQAMRVGDFSVRISSGRTGIEGRGRINWRGYERMVNRC